MRQKHTKHRGFTLVELLVVIGIIALIVGASLPNFLGARQRARDVQRKAQLGELKKALRLYYNDYNKYPADSGGPVYNKIKGCGAAGTSDCPCSTAIDFASGAACDNVYMKKFPAEFGSRIYYYQIAGGDDFLLKVALENASDPDKTTSQARCPGVSPKSCGTSDYCVCAD